MIARAAGPEMFPVTGAAMAGDTAAAEAPAKKSPDVESTIKTTIAVAEETPLIAAPTSGSATNGRRGPPRREGSPGVNARMTTTHSFGTDCAVPTEGPVT